MSGSTKTSVRLARTGDTPADLLRQRLLIQDGAADSLESALNALADDLGDRIEAALDGAPTGDTAFEARMRALPDGEQVRVAAMAAELSEIVDLVNDAGLDNARREYLTQYGPLQDVAERAMAAAGVERADVLLDSEAISATVDAIMGRHDDALFGTLARDSATRIVDALHTQVGLESHAEIAQRIVDAEGASIPAAMTEARTRLAEADRFFAEAATSAAEDEGDVEFLRVYVGPDDSRTRDFCEALVGKAFTVAELQPLSNGQTPAHPLVSGGGYNCRHGFVSVHPDDLESVGYERGTSSDIAQANAGASRRKSKKRKKR